VGIKTTIHQSVSALARFSAVAATIALVAQVLAAIIFPIAEVILREQAQALPAFVLPTIYTIHVVVGVLATWAFLRGRDFIAAANVATLLASFEKLQEESLAEQAKVASYRGQTQALLAKSAAVQGSASVLQGLLRRRSSGGPDRAEIEALLAPLIRDRSRALEFASDDLYNFVVYAHDPGTDTLVILFRSCDDRIETHNRSWARGRGHVGSAFAQGETIVVRDSSQEGIGLSAGALSTDAQFYVSFVLSPIPNSNPRARDPIGVFVMTSNRAGHFDEDDRILADTFSLILSMYVTFRTGRVSRRGGRSGRR